MHPKVGTLRMGVAEDLEKSDSDSLMACKTRLYSGPQPADIFVRQNDCNVLLHHLLGTK